MRSFLTIERYNALENIQERSADVFQYVLDQLGPIFAKHDAHRTFGIVPMHRYRELAEDEVLMVEALLATPGSCRERTIKTRDVDIARVHGDCFAVQSNGNIVPYKLRQGKVAPFKFENTEFLQDFSAYMLDMGLNDLLGLQILREALPQGIESNLEEGTVFATGFNRLSNSFTKQNAWVLQVDPNGNTKYRQTVYVSIADLPGK